MGDFIEALGQRLGVLEARPGSTSNFKVNPKNILGLDARKTRSKLLALALSKPEQYYELRERVIEKMTENAVDELYNVYWGALTNGVVKEQQLQFPGGGNFHPNLPESDVNKFALKCANAIYEISQEAVESILPLRFKDLAIESQEAILSERGVKI
jgi:hypothetical protein